MAKHSLLGATVVITGASSGIGRAAALAFAREGAYLVLAARRKQVLEDVVAQCMRLGARAIAVPTDVTDAHSVTALAETAANRFNGRIDVWINNAGVGAVGRFTETPVAAHEQVIRTNLLGPIHGAWAALPFFLRQGSGVLINNISFGAWVPAPYAAAYSASKFGLRGYSEALRGELLDWPDIHICDLYPSFINTPGLDRGANYTGRHIGSTNLGYNPHRVARAMVSLAKRPRHSATVGMQARLIRLAHFLAPGLTLWGVARFTELYLNRASPAPGTDGSLFHPIPVGTDVYGRTPGQKGRLIPAMITGAATTGLALLWLMRFRNREQPADWSRRNSPQGPGTDRPHPGG